VKKHAPKIEIPAEPPPPKPTYEEIEGALVTAGNALDFVGMDRWESECLGPSLRKISDLVNRIKSNWTEQQFKAWESEQV
jgi:hypothetical protein